MDHTDDRIEEDIKDILKTRVAISDKLEMLEQRVEEKMERSRMAVKDLVDHTAEVVESMMDKTKRTLDPLHQYNQRPWLILGGAIMLGYIAGLIEAKMRSSGVYPYYTPDTTGATVMPPGSKEERAAPDEGVYPYYPTGEDRERGADARRMPPHLSIVQDVADGLMEELDHIKAGVIAAGRVFLREVSTQIIPSLLHSLGDRVMKSAGSSERASSFRSPDR
ncbi:MAG TPA: hypothetical protein VHF07_08540 [Nitrospiraceae bacterium]|nr:hypothetical protein [Nitrospiraceae bacterium]